MKRWRIKAASLAFAATIYPWSAPAQEPPASSATPSRHAEFNTLIGRWVRSDGGYAISVKAVDANGKLEANYTNPNSLPFHTAEVTRDGENLKLFFELHAGGYGGSTYTLNYEAASDQLRGVYYQAVAKQKFNVVFVRAK